MSRILLRTDLPPQWETGSHNTLGIRGQVIDEAPGDEWFNTSVADVLRIIECIGPSLKAGC